MLSIYVIGGYSGAGKDTAAAAIENSEVVKFARPAKDALEFIYGLPVGALDDRVKRLEIAPHSGGKTYLEVLVNFWEHRNLLLGGELFPNQVKDRIVETLSRNKHAVITDMRSIEEMEVLRDLAKSYPLHCLWIGGGEKLKSDVTQKELIDKLSKRSVMGDWVKINNTRKLPIAAFQAAVKTTINYLDFLA
jgi:hypothetical protein